MKHLEEHEHAFLDENNVVINVGVFEGHDSDLLNTLKNSNNANKIICCCDNGLAVIGGTWNGQYFLDKDGFRVPPTRPPYDGINNYIYNWEINEWVTDGPSEEVLFSNINNVVS